MGDSGPVKRKSYDFALHVVQLFKGTAVRQREPVLTRQLVRAATSIGANVEEAIAAQTRKDFITRMAIASKEARESRYWIRLLRDAELLSAQTAIELMAECDELIKLLTATVKTGQRNNRTD